MKLKKKNSVVDGYDLKTLKNVPPNDGKYEQLPGLSV